MERDKQKIIVSEPVVNILRPTWLIVTHKAVDILIRLQSRLPIGTSEMIPVILERRILVLATIKVEASPDLYFMLASDLLETICHGKASARVHLPRLLQGIMQTPDRGPRALSIYLHGLTSLSIISGRPVVEDCIPTELHTNTLSKLGELQ